MTSAPAGRLLTPSRVRLGFLVLAVCLIPQIVQLGVDLPNRTLVPYWRAAWTGFHIGIALGLLASGVLLLRRSPWLVVAASATATVLLADAWFSVLTRERRPVLLSLLVTVPLAALCLWVSSRIVGRVRSVTRAGAPVPPEEILAPAVPRWVAALFLALAAVGIAGSLGPSRVPTTSLAGHWTAAWVGFDVLLAAGFAVSAGLVHVRSPWAVVSVSANAAMLLCDAWFDCLTAAGTSGLATSLVLAALVELPLAALCLLIAGRIVRRMSAARAAAVRALAERAAESGSVAGP